MRRIVSHRGAAGGGNTAADGKILAPRAHASDFPHCSSLLAVRCDGIFISFGLAGLGIGISVARFFLTWSGLLRGEAMMSNVCFLGNYIIHTNVLYAPV